MSKNFIAYMKLNPGQSLRGTFISIKEQKTKYGLKNVLYLYRLDETPGPVSMFITKHLEKLFKSNPSSMKRGADITVSCIGEQDLGNSVRMFLYDLVVHEQEHRPSRSGPDGTVFDQDDNIISC